MHENKKVCVGCGRRRKLGKFGKQSCNPDGKNIYCRDCMRVFRSNYKQSSRGKELQKKCVTAYKRKNKKAIKEYNKKYYSKNKSRILYNKKARECTESVLIFEKSKKPIKKKINKGSDICINPKRKK